MLRVNPNLIKNMGMYKPLSYIEDGRSNWHRSVLVGNSGDKIWFIEKTQGNLPISYLVSPAEYGKHIKDSDWINYRGKYAKVLAAKKTITHAV